MRHTKGTSHSNPKLITTIKQKTKIRTTACNVSPQHHGQRVHSDETPVAICVRHRPSLMQGYLSLRPPVLQGRKASLTHSYSLSHLTSPVPFSHTPAVPEATRTVQLVQNLVMFCFIFKNPSHYSEIRGKQNKTNSDMLLILSVRKAVTDTTGRLCPLSPESD